METIEKRPLTKEQPEAGELNSVIDAAIAREAVGLENEIKEAKQQLGVLPESAADNVAELVAPEITPEKKETAKPAGPVISEQERMDAKMDASQKGWARYWGKRLLPEISILPEPVKNVIEKYIREGKFSFLPGEESDYYGYIKGRITAKRFEISKREAMAKLKGELRNIDTGEFSPESLKDKRVVRYDEKSKSLLVKNDDGSEKEITFGDLVGDYTWGIKYAPDQSMPRQLWRKIAKTMALHEARNTVSAVYDNELAHYHGIPSGVVATIPLDYIEKRINKEKKAFGKIGRSTAGAVAERMITEFLTRIQYNNADLGFKIENANALEDTMLKYDFKIIAKKRRGIALEAEDTPRDQIINNKRNLGIQFTTSSQPETLTKKETAVGEARKKIHEYEDFVKRQVDDIVIVSMPELSEFAELYDRWVNEDRPSGGPEQYLAREQKLEIFNQATAGLVDLSKQELAELKI